MIFIFEFLEFKVSQIFPNTHGTIYLVKLYYNIYVPEAYILHFTNSCYFSHHTCLPVRFSKFGNCLQNIRGVYPKRPWNIVISTNNLAGLYTQSVCDENLRISCIFFVDFHLGGDFRYSYI